jgi:hypothetical protein
MPPIGSGGCEYFWVFGGKSLHLVHDGIEMRFHGPTRGFGLSGLDGRQNVTVLRKGHGVTTGRGEELADAIHARSGGFDYCADPSEAEALDQHLVKRQIKSVKGGPVAPCNRRFLLGKEVVERGNDGIWEAPSRLLGHGCLQRAPNQHRLDHLGKANERSASATLRQDLNQSLGGETGERFRYRKTRHRQSFADQRLVYELARFELQPDNRRSQHSFDPLGRIAARTSFESREETIGLPLAHQSGHSSMLVEPVIGGYAVPGF